VNTDLSQDYNARYEQVYLTDLSFFISAK
jgi:hypothetical protein